VKGQKRVRRESMDRTQQSCGFRGGGVAGKNGGGKQNRFASQCGRSETKQRGGRWSRLPHNWQEMEREVFKHQYKPKGGKKIKNTFRGDSQGGNGGGQSSVGKGGLHKTKEWGKKLPSERGVLGVVTKENRVKSTGREGAKGVVQRRRYGHPLSGT